MTITRAGSDLLGQVLCNLGEARFRLLTSIESESAIPEFLDDLRDKLNRKELTLYFVNPARQVLETGPRLGLRWYETRHRQSLDLNNSVPGKAVLSGMTVFEPVSSIQPAVHNEPLPRAELAIPIQLGQEVVAVLDLVLFDRAPFPESHRLILDLIARDLAIALANTKAVKKLKTRLSTDELTGLYNHDHFMEHLEIEIKRSIRNDASLALLLVEIDNLAEISARLGIASRDMGIQQVGRILKKNLRATNLLGRFSDNEFALTLGGTDIDKALFVADKFRKLLVQEPVEDLGPVGINIGIAIYPVHALEKDELVFMARQAACLARYGGGNHISVIGSDRMKTMALKAFAAILNTQTFDTGPQLAHEVATHLEEVASDPIFSPVVKQIVESLASAIDAKDHYTKNHSEEATTYAEALGRVCNLTEKQMEIVRMAAKLHDIGKIGVPEKILNKNGPLDEQEWQLMREHPTIGANILKPIEHLADLVPIVRYHHERWNGSGYPLGMKGTEIPLEARLIGVIDSFHAIISERPYKKALPVSYALDQLRKQAGITFDPFLIDKFCSLMNSNGNLWPEGAVLCPA
jgi:diguanylate cyclase (GGDEF)-like protein/putative nucleotidyltransferase with HDIG domain